MRLPAILLLLALTACTPSSSSPEPAAVPSPTGDAGKQLAALKVAREGSNSGYDREKFPHWSEQEGNCDTRELVLKRDGKGVKTGSDCYPRSGKWTSPYDGETWERASDVDIDHMVPLAEAWQSGADEWSQDRRGKFANDLKNPQLWAVTDNVNQQKSDQDPAEWKPPIRGFWCTYVKSWINVKYVYRLTVDQAEKRALVSMLDRC